MPIVVELFIKNQEDLELTGDFAQSKQLFAAGFVIN